MNTKHYLSLFLFGLIFQIGCKVNSQEGQETACSILDDNSYTNKDTFCEFFEDDTKFECSQFLFFRDVQTNSTSNLQPYNKEIIINNSYFILKNVPINFSNIEFTEIVKFFKCKFESKLGLKFSRSKINKFRFDNCCINTRALFNEEVVFRDSTLFYYTHFKQESNFTSAIFDSVTVFTGSRFDTLVNYTKAKFKGKTDFSSTEFNGKVNFTMAEFNDVKFTNATFNDSLNFSDAKFSGIADFSKATLSKSINLSNVTTKNIIDLSMVQVKDGECNIYLMDFDLEKIRFYYDDFKLEFLQSDTKPVKKTQLYKRLLEKFKKEGLDSSYEKLYKEYKEFSFKKDYGSFFGSILNFFQKNGWDYGFGKANILITLFVFFVILFIFNFAVRNYLNNVGKIGPTKKTKIYKRIFLFFTNIFLIKDCEIFKKSFISTSIFFFGISLNFDVLMQEFKKTKKGVPLRIYIVSIFTYIVGLIMMGFFLNSFVTVAPDLL